MSPQPSWESAQRRGALDAARLCTPGRGSEASCAPESGGIAGCAPDLECTTQRIRVVHSPSGAQLRDDGDLGTQRAPVATDWVHNAARCPQVYAAARRTRVRCTQKRSFAAQCTGERVHWRRSRRRHASGGTPAAARQRHKSDFSNGIGPLVTRMKRDLTPTLFEHLEYLQRFDTHRESKTDLRFLGKRRTFLKNHLRKLRRHLL